MQYDDTSESIVTDDLPSLYSVPHKFRSESRCSSITFDLTDAEGYNRNRSKSRNKKQKERKENKEESQANIFAREEPEIVPVVGSGYGGLEREAEVEESFLSLWSCRRCTLENPLQEPVCLACGGSRLSSIGDIEVPRVVEPKNLVNLIKEEDEELDTRREVNDPANKEGLARWKCGVCTLENEPLNYFCDACNTPNPLQQANKNRTKDEVLTRAADPNTELGILLSKAVRLEIMQAFGSSEMEMQFSNIFRYLGIACFCLIFICAIFNMISSLCISLQSFIKPDQNSVNEQEEMRESIEAHNTLVEAETDANYSDVRLLTDEMKLKKTNEGEETADNTANHDNVYIYQIFYETFGIFPIIFAIYWPLFLYLIAKICKVGAFVTQVTEPRVPQPL